MRDKRFVAEHRGGPLGKEQHYQLSKWACDCSQHVLDLLGDHVDERLTEALEVARKWRKGEASVGESRKASVLSHSVARESDNLTDISIARSIGHAVATAHMADHSLGGAYYALKAIKNENRSVQKEMEWQQKQLPIEIRELVILAWEKRGFKI